MLVITRFVPLDAMATNFPLPYVTLFQEFASGAAIVVHVIASELYAIRFVPLFATATYFPPPYATELHAVVPQPEMAVLLVHVAPLSALLIRAHKEPTATNFPPP